MAAPAPCPSRLLPSAPPHPPALPRHFELLRPIGAGAGGAVHAARDRRNGRLVAIKLVALAGSPTLPLASAAARFDAEAATAQRLQHPDIVATLESGRAGNLGWLVMELVGGVALSRYTHTARLLPDAWVLRAGARLATALSHAHRQGVLHRDIKPANVLVDLGADVIKLGDFGLARDADSQATRTGLVMGSPAYMAPELLAGAAPSVSTDLYALGATLFELLTGQLPFPNEGSMGEMLRRVAQQPAPRLLALRALQVAASDAGDHFDPTAVADAPGQGAGAGAAHAAGAPGEAGAADPVAVVWAGVDELLARLLAKRAAQRPADAAAVAETLRALHRALPAAQPPARS
jgi:eukaryotic-like serine/threonine-protein kinase